MRKVLTISLLIVLALSYSAFASDTQKQERSISESDRTEIICVDDNVLDMNLIEQRRIDSYNEGLAKALRESGYSEDNTIEQNESIIDSVIESYTTSHYDPLSGAIYEDALSRRHSGDISIIVDDNAELYRANTHRYQVNDTLSICIDPEYIYVDISSPGYGSIREARKASSWKYRDAFARRTLFRKVTVKGESYTFKLYSVHTGGRVKYNGDYARHSSSYQAYAQNEAGGNLSFTQTVKLSEAFDDTGWHYKYMGKVSGKVTVTSPVRVTISLPEKTLGCEARITKKGTVTKYYWPAIQS